jgi:hypothetical protein
MNPDDIVKTGIEAGRQLTTETLKAHTEQHGGVAACAKCGRVFTSHSQYRYRGKDGLPICRNEHACRIMGGVQSEPKQ